MIQNSLIGDKFYIYVRKESSWAFDDGNIICERPQAKNKKKMVVTLFIIHI